jgi:hypothetical protein
LKMFLITKQMAFHNKNSNKRTGPKFSF